MKENVLDVSTMNKEDETVDEILGGRLRIFQKKKGYRFSLDAFLLAHFIRLKKDDLIIDLGTGSGVIAIIMGKRKECGKVVGIDVQEELVDMAKRSVEVNTLCNKVEIRQGDLRQIKQLFTSQSFEDRCCRSPWNCCWIFRFPWDGAYPWCIGYTRFHAVCRKYFERSPVHPLSCCLYRGLPLAGMDHSPDRTGRSSRIKILSTFPHSIFLV